MSQKSSSAPLTPQPHRKKLSEMPKATPEPIVCKVADDLEPLLCPIDTVVPDPDNAREHGEGDLPVLAGSLERFGQLKPIVAQIRGVKSKPMVRAGNGTLEAARSLGWTHIACVKQKMTKKEARAFAILDNRTAELSAWDEKALQAAVKSFSEAEAQSLGFDPDDLGAILEPLGGSGWAGPKTDPSLDGASHVTEAAIATAEADMGTRFSGGEDPEALLDVCCPSCGENFKVKA